MGHMPELPEIETVKLQLRKVLVGQKILKFEIRNLKTVKGSIDEIVGKRVESVERKGKVLLINFGPSASSGQALRLGFHFKMTGQLVYVPHPNPLLTSGEGTRIVGGHPTKDFMGELPSKHTRVVFTFDKGKLYFNDQRLFGWVEINPKFINNIGPEPFNLSGTEFIKLIKGLRRPVKVMLMDQALISGVGNIYANDACWEARINPSLLVSKLTVDQMDLLFKKLKLVLREGIKYGGATAADEKYMSLHGMGGHYQDHFRVYGREKKECLRNDKGTIKKVILGGRGTYFCPVCQK
jgi:formamidopyrimidine-DNA glycosylase